MMTPYMRMMEAMFAERVEDRQMCVRRLEQLRELRAAEAIIKATERKIAAIDDELEMAAAMYARTRRVMDASRAAP